MKKVEEVLVVLRSHKDGLYKHEIAKLVGKTSSNQVGGHLNHLECYGKIKRGNFGRYVINE